ncbi:fatty acid hydroxylase superfamily-domain-containing protein [Scleroderma yunnanense]
MSYYEFPNATCRPPITGFEGYLPPLEIPFYFSSRERLIGDIPDATLALVAPVIAFWVYSIAFDLLDHSGWKWLDPYRIHEPDEIKSRNLVSRSEVIIAVISQQVMQSAVGFILLEDVPGISLAHCQRELKAIESTLVGLVQQNFIPRLLVSILAFHKGETAYWLYWWIIPVSRLIVALLIFDAWMYFGHRMMHLNKFLYKHIHSIHHRLYVPYAYGSVYNHPVEGFLLDVMGSFVASFVARLTPRESVLFFTFSILKGVHQHSGYQFIYDPIRWFSNNDAEYHDIHHQAIGMKYNFAQPFFVHWDVIMGTRLTKKDIKRKQKVQ